MTTTLSTIFFISLFAVIYILAVKTLEEKKGKKILMPESVSEKDEQIKRNTEYFIKRALHIGKYKTQIVGHSAVEHIKRGAGKVASLKKQNGDTPKGNGNGSIFLKRVKEHKREIRENGESGKI